MARASVTAENAALTGMASVMTFFALHSGDPGTTGATEISGGTYARVAYASAAAAAGAIANSAALTLNVPAATTVAYCGCWNAATVGTYEIGAALASSQTFNTAGTETFAIGAVSFSAS